MGPSDPSQTIRRARSRMVCDDRPAVGRTIVSDVQMAGSGKSSSNWRTTRRNAGWRWRASPPLEPANASGDHRGAIGPPSKPGVRTLLRLLSSARDSEHAVGGSRWPSRTRDGKPIAIDGGRSAVDQRARWHRTSSPLSLRLNGGRTSRSPRRRPRLLDPGHPDLDSWSRRSTGRAWHHRDLHQSGGPAPDRRILVRRSSRESCDVVGEVEPDSPVGRPTAG